MVVSIFVFFFNLASILIILIRTPAKYGVVKKWFMTRFPNYNQMTQFDENGNIIRSEVTEAAKHGSQEKPISD